MKTVFALTALAAVAAAIPQESSTPTVSLSPQASCAAACAPTDICCQAGCAGVPCPDEDQANDTTSCAAECDQGDGSESDTKAYADCQQACISSLFLTATATRPAPTAPSAPSVTSSVASTSATASASGDETSEDSTATGSESGSASPTASETGDEDSSETDEPTSTGPDGAESTGGEDDDSAASSISIPLGASALGAMSFILAALAF